MDNNSLFDAAQEFTYFGIKINAIQLLALFMLRLIARSPRAHAGYDSGIAWSIFGALAWCALAGAVMFAGVITGGGTLW